MGTFVVPTSSGQLVKSFECTWCRTNLLRGSDGFAVETGRFAALAFTCWGRSCTDLATEAAALWELFSNEWF